MKDAIMILLISLLNLGKLQAQNISDNDREFINEAAQRSMLEVKLGELAQTHASTDKVKVLGEHMMTDHTKAENDLKALASKKGVVVPTNLDEKRYSVYHKLVNKQGKDFDKAYTKWMVKDYKEDLGKFKTEADKGDDAELKSWAENRIPTLEHHKTMSEEACKAVKEKK